MIEPFTPRFFKNLQQLRIHTRRTFLGSRQGIHVSSRRGHGIEFADHRAYAPGDDFRHIDWNTYGRTDRLYVRQFREEQDLNVMVLLDTSRSMMFPDGEQKFELARDLAIALGYVALSDGDSVRFSLLGQKNTPVYRSPRAISQAIKQVRAATADTTFTLSTELRAAVEQHKTPGKCFFISDFLYEQEIIVQALEILLAKGFDISLIRVLAPSEMSLQLDASNSFVVDAESGELVELELGGSSQKDYARLVAEHIDQLENYCVSHNISHLLVSSDESLSDIVLKRLPVAGVLK